MQSTLKMYLLVLGTIFLVLPLFVSGAAKAELVEKGASIVCDPVNRIYSVSAVELARDSARPDNPGSTYKVGWTSQNEGTLLTDKCTIENTIISLSIDYRSTNPHGECGSDSPPHLEITVLESGQGGFSRDLMSSIDKESSALRRFDDTCSEQKSVHSLVFWVGEDGNVYPREISFEQKK